MRFKWRHIERYLNCMKTIYQQPRPRALRYVLTSVAAIVMLAFCERSCASSSSHGHADHAAEEEVDSSDLPPDVVRGVEVGEFRIRAYYPVQAQKSQLRFILHLTAKGERYAAMRKLVTSRRHKVRDQVITGARLVPLADLNEPDPKSFRRRILLRLRRTMPELPVDDIYVSNFELKIQSL